MLSEQSAVNIEQNDTTEAGLSGYAWDDETELLKLVDEITKDQKPCHRPKLTFHIPKNIKLPPVMETSLIDLHNMSLPSIKVSEDAMTLIFNESNRVVGRPFSREKEAEAIKDVQKILPCAFCFTTNQAKNSAFKHTYLDKKGNVNCYLVNEFVNRIYTQQVEYNDGLRATKSKVDIELLLRKHLEEQNKEPLLSTWPLASLPLRLRDIDLDEIEHSSYNEQKSPHKFSPYINIFDFLAEKSQSYSTETLSQAISKPTFATELRKSTSDENIIETELNSLEEPLKHETMGSKDELSSNDDDIPCSFGGDLSSGSPDSGIHSAHLHSSPIRDIKQPLNFPDNFTGDSQGREDPYFEEISFANLLGYPEVASF